MKLYVASHWETTQDSWEFMGLEGEEMNKTYQGPTLYPY